MSMDRIEGIRPTVSRAPVSSPDPRTAPPASAEPRPPGWLTPEELRDASELKRRDAEVREQERAQLSVGGPYVHGAQYQHRIGPDGRQYAVHGEVDLDVAPVPGSPEATIKKMQVVGRAARASARPSIQDRRVAALAARLELLARQELRRQQAEAARHRGPPGSTTGLDPPIDLET